MMVMLRAMVLGRLGGLFTPIHERVLYPSHRPGGGVAALFPAALRFLVQNRFLVQTLGAKIGLDF